MSQTVATSASSQSAAEQGSHFYVLTLEKPTRHGVSIGTKSGTFTPPDGWTTYDFHKACRAELEHDQPELRGGVVVFFDIRPNQL